MICYMLAWGLHIDSHVCKFDDNLVDETEKFGMKQLIKITKPARLCLLRAWFLLHKRRMAMLVVSGTLCKVEKSLRKLHLQQTTNLPFPFTYVLVEVVCFKVIFQGNQSEVSVR